MHNDTLSSFIISYENYVSPFILHAKFLFHALRILLLTPRSVEDVVIRRWDASVGCGCSVNSEADTIWRFDQTLRFGRFGPICFARPRDAAFLVALVVSNSFKLLEAFLVTIRFASALH
jgi:hypothetical protein